MNATSQDANFHLGLLHFVHLLVSADGQINEQEKKAINSIKRDEGIPVRVFQHFVQDIISKSEREVFTQGVDLLNQCSEEERLCAFVHLYRLAKADDALDLKEVKLLLYSLKQTKIEFEDVVLSAHLAVAQEQSRNQKWIA